MVAKQLSIFLENKSGRFGFRLYLSSVNVHSTWGATSANTLRVKSCGFHLPELCGQDFLGHMANRIVQFAKPFCPRHQAAEAQSLPLIADESERCSHRAGCAPLLVYR